MDYAGIRDTLKQLHGANVQITRNGQWATTPCPFARWTHPRGTDRSPSFGVHENANGTSVFHCFTCKKKGTIPMLWEFLGELDGNDYSEFIDEAESSEILGPKLPSWEATGRKAQLVSELGTPLSEEINLVYEHAFNNVDARRYLRQRHIHRRTSEALGLLHDPDDGHGVQRIIFPVRSIGGDLFGYTARALDSDVEPRIRDYYGLDKRLLLLGAENLSDVRSAGGDPIVLVEGLFDYAKVRQAGFEVVASMGSGLTESQLSILKRLGRGVVIMYDNDKAGTEGADSVQEALEYHIPIFRVRYPHKPGRPEWNAHHSDPGSLASKRIQQMIDDRRLII